jgi:hypothetical protein
MAKLPCSEASLQFGSNRAGDASDDSPLLAGNPSQATWPKRPPPALPFEPFLRRNTDQQVVLVARADLPVVLLSKGADHLVRPRYGDRGCLAFTDHRFRAVFQGEGHMRLRAHVTRLDTTFLDAQVETTTSPHEPDGDKVGPAIGARGRQPDIGFSVEPAAHSRRRSCCRQVAYPLLREHLAPEGPCRVHFHRIKAARVDRQPRHARAILVWGVFPWRRKRSRRRTPAGSCRCSLPGLPGRGPVRIRQRSIWPGSR